RSSPTTRPPLPRSTLFPYTTLFRSDVQVKNVSRELAEVGVHGPLAAKALQAAVGIPAARLDSLNQYDNVRAPGSATTVVRDAALDRKSTRLNSSHVSIWYAVFCLKK